MSTESFIDVYNKLQDCGQHKKFKQMSIYFSLREIL